MNKDFGEVTLASNVYEKTYRLILNGDWGERLFLYNIDFSKIISKKISTITDVDNVGELELLLNRAVDGKLFDKYLWCEDKITFLQEIWKGIDRKSFIDRYINHRKLIMNIRERRPMLQGVIISGDGYWYSLPAITAIGCCETRWLLYVEADCYLDRENITDWLLKSIELMSKHDEFICSNPRWDTIDVIKSEAIDDIGDFFVSAGFSNNCFLVDADRLRSIPDLFCYKTRDTKKRYPTYGGNCFERRFNAYMQKKGLKRLTYKYCLYHNDDLRNKKV